MYQRQDVTYLLKFNIPLVRPLDLASKTYEALLELLLGRSVDHLRLHLCHIRAPVPDTTQTFVTGNTLLCVTLC